MTGIAPFSVAPLPRILFGSGVRDSIAAEVGALGKRALVVIGRRSLRASPHWRKISGDLAGEGATFEIVAVDGEPSPELVDGLVADHRDAGVEVVLGIGGGSVLDAAKAVAGLLRPGNSVMDHLEGVGAELPYAGPAVPWVAVPTTAGTGSEATKNAVLSVRGPGGFKKSFRDDRLIARAAIVDPDFLESCPPDLMAADGMDALTQLLESFVSTRAGPVTDALAWSGLEAFRDGFFAAWRGNGPEAAAGRTQIAYASLISGICLAQTGLGAVHGLASPLGAFFPVPHGVVCGTLVAAVTRANILALRDRAPESPALAKYARVGRLLIDDEVDGTEGVLGSLVRTLEEWVEALAIPRLGAFGMTAADIDAVIVESSGGSMRTNPIALTEDELAGILSTRL